MSCERFDGQWVTSWQQTSLRSAAIITRRYGKASRYLRRNPQFSLPAPSDVLADGPTVSLTNELPVGHFIGRYPTDEL